MDRIVDCVRGHPEQHEGAQLRYSMPREYHKALLGSLQQKTQQIDTTAEVSQSSKLSLPTITGSPFLNYWTGHCAQLPALKQMVRSVELLLRTVQMTMWSQLRPGDKLSARTKDGLRQAQETVWLMQHHDAITSTSHRFVLMDYMKRLQQAFRIMKQILTDLATEQPKIAREPSVSSFDYYRTLEAQREHGTIIGGGPHLHETALVRGSGARSIELERIADPHMEQAGVELTVLNSLNREVKTLVSFVCTRPDTAVSHGQ